MNRYPSKELGFYDVVKWSFRLHYLSLKYSIACILLITVAKYASIFITTWVQNYYLERSVTCVFALAILFFFSAALLATHRAFVDRPKPIGDAINSIWKRVVPIYTTFLLYVVCSVVIYYLCLYLIIGLDKIIYGHAQSHTMHGTTVIIAFALVMVFVGMFFFSYPLAVIDEKSLPKAFHDSALLGEKNKLGVLFLFMVAGSIYLLLKPNTIHEYLLSLYHQEALYDFVVLCVIVPLFINLLLFLIHDSKQQIISTD